VLNIILHNKDSCAGALR